MEGTGQEAAADEFNTLVDRTGYLCNRIQVSLDFLCKKSTNLKEVLVHLISNNVLSQRESELVENEKSSYDSFHKLFTFLNPKLGHGDNSKHFVNAFQQSGNEHILEELKSAVVTTDFAPLPPDASFRSIRFNLQEPVASFFGREKFLRDLQQQILQSQRTTADVSTNSTIISRIAVVTGLGGIGKTETVRKYIHSYGSCYQNVVWIDAEEHKTAENQFRKLALELQLSAKHIDNRDKDFDFILKEIYGSLCTSHTLVIFDNAEALDDSDPQRPGVARFLPTPLLPTHLKPVIIITSRQLDWPDLHPMALPLWTPQESRAFIFRQLKLEESDANAKAAETLSETFGGLPLALQAAVAVIRQQSKLNEMMGKDYTIQHLLSDYSEGQREVLKNRPPGSPHTQPLMLLWKVSLDKIRQQPHGDLAADVLNVVAHLSATNIPKGLLSFIFKSDDVQSFMVAMALLVDYSFVHNSRTHFYIHRMLQDVTLAHLEAPTEDNPRKRKLLVLIPLLIRITTALSKYWPTVPKSSEAFDAVLDNLVHVTMSHVLPKVQNPSETDLHFIEFIEFVLEEIKDTRWVETEKCCRVLITYFTNSTLDSHSASLFESPQFKKVLRLRRKLVWHLMLMGRYKEAVDICQESLSSLNSLEDQQAVMEEILDTKHYLASILYSQSKYEEAIKLFYSVTDLRTKLHGPIHKLTLETKNNLALSLQKSGRLSDAKTLYEEILEVEMKDAGPRHRSTLITKHNMALILRDEGRYDEALEMMRAVVEVKELELGVLHAHTLISKNSMAGMLDAHGKDEDALRIYDHVISSYEKASAASHPECLKAKYNIARILGKQGKVDEAKEMLCQVLDIQERLLGFSHVDTLDTKHNVAWVLGKQGKHTEAMKLFEEVLELRTKHLGPVHPSTLETNNSIGLLHREVGNLEKAESIAKEVPAGRQATLPSDYPNYKDTAI